MHAHTHVHTRMHSHTMYFILVIFVTATDKKLYFQIWAFWDVMQHRQVGTDISGQLHAAYKFCFIASQL
jgi:hypothetical protein